jgi:AraC-like DNA-binding protein
MAAPSGPTRPFTADVAHGETGAQPSDRYRVWHTNDRDEAEDMVRRVFLPNRIEPLERGSRLSARLVAGQVGSVAMAYLSYGAHVRLITEETANYHVNLPVRGSGVLTGTVGGELLRSTTERAAVFSPGDRAVLDWPGDCAQLCVMYRSADVTDELENMLGRPLRRRLEFAADLDVTLRGGLSWATATRLVRQEFERPDGMMRHPLAVRALETVLIEALLIGQRHTYTEELNAPTPPSSNTAIRRAVELLEDQPGRAWSAGSLAREAMLSVRSLHAGFRRDIGISPMSYLKQVRLRRAYHDLRAANPSTTSVREIAAHWGFLHHGRFSAAYRNRYGVTPSDSLRAHE